MDHKILKSGNSLAVSIPSDFAHTLGLRPGQSVSVHTDLTAGRLILTFPNSGQLPLLPKKAK